MSSHAADSGTGTQERWRIEAASAGLCAIATVAGWALPHLGWASLAQPALLVAYAAGGWDTFRRTVGALRRGALDVDLLMLLAAAGAATVDHWLEGAILLFLFSLGNTLETYAFGHTRRSIRALMELRPDEASRVENGEERTVRIETLDPGDVVRVRPGDRIPVDGVVIAGSTHVDESTLTGEPIPVAKKTDASVFAGTLNGAGSIDVRMTKGANDTTLARVIRLVEEARESQAPTQSWIEAVEGRYATGVILGAAMAVLVPWLAFGWTFDDAFYRAMTLLVVASPCALVISIPATIVSAVSNGARHGVLFKGGAHLDALADVRVAALDKTGTLTEGRPEVAAIRVFDDEPFSEEEALALAAAAEVRSEHPLGEAVSRAAAARGISVTEAEDFRSVPAQGVAASVQGHEVRIGRRSWVEAEVGGPIPQAAAEWLADQSARGATPVLLAVDGRHTAAFAVADRPRKRVREALAAMKAEGIHHIVMLTGDDRVTARAVGDALGIDEVHAELNPEDKRALLATLRERHGPVAMVGDGVNDAPALAAADVGIALGAAGTDVALETADIVIMGEELGEIAHAVALSRRARRVVRQNLTFAVSVMAILVVLALGGWIGLTTGVIGHEGSTIVVVFNGLRLLRDA